MRTWPMRSRSSAARSAGGRSSVSRKPRTLLAVCVAALGVHRGALTAAWLVEHALATRGLGHVPTAAEYAEWAFVEERTAWRRRASLRAVFGDDGWREVVARLAELPELDRSGSLRRLVEIPVPA